MTITNMRIEVVGLLRVKTMDVKVLERDRVTGMRIGMISLLRVKVGVLRYYSETLTQIWEANWLVHLG